MFIVWLDDVSPVKGGNLNVSHQWPFQGLTISKIRNLDHRPALEPNPDRLLVPVVFS